ncbi:prepilin-type N-terminal cleavage/methylation domain-containing protein [Cytobacillus praedii]|uniref:PulJ/GspJ family protein n=1 Tax=Cytobacillus praedii TaxID=1742358 RepID=UPI002E1D7A2C|nr:prepilin-type N-terminal cleavage/methylation domain-containing protein [Cytobacillus praedii]
MIKKYLSKESGLTLIELLAALTISMAVIGAIYGVLNSSLKFNNKTQSHIDLRQEANIIITQLRQQHQGGNYDICYDQLLFNDKLSFDKLSLNNSLISKGQCSSIESSVDLVVKFTLADKEHNTFDIDTVIESKRGSSSLAIDIEKPNTSFYDYLKFNNIFVYGKQFAFEGDKVNGSNATMVILGNILGSQINGGAYGKVSNIYIDGYGVVDSGQQFGSNTHPGTLYFNGDLSLGSYQDIYGDVYINGNFKNIGSTINGNVYVNGDVELGWTPTIVGNAKIFYTGTLSYPKNGYPQSVLSKLIHQSEVPLLKQSIEAIPDLKPTQWYVNNGYSSKIKPNNMKIYGDNIKIQSYYDQNLGKYVDTFSNSIIVSEGDITVSSGGLKMTGVLFAPKGKVTFNGTSFEGLVIARDGFFVVSGGTTLTFKGIENYIKDVKDFPLQ